MLMVHLIAATLAFNGTNWEDAAVIRSTDNWVANDSAIATTKAGDARWLKL